MNRNGMLSGIALLVGVSAAQVVAASDKAGFISGEWYETANGTGDCGSDASTVLKPMTLRTGETLCSFRTVRQDDKIVTWRGQCSEESLTYPAVVVATYNDGKATLTISFSGGSTLTELKRCPVR